MSEGSHKKTIFSVILHYSWEPGSRELNWPVNLGWRTHAHRCKCFNVAGLKRSWEIGKRSSIVLDLTCSERGKEEHRNLRWSPWISNVAIDCAHLIKPGVNLFRKQHEISKQVMVWHEQSCKQLSTAFNSLNWSWRLHSSWDWFTLNTSRQSKRSSHLSLQTFFHLLDEILIVTTSIRSKRERMSDRKSSGSWLILSSLVTA